MIADGSLGSAVKPGFVGKRLSSFKLSGLHAAGQPAAASASGMLYSVGSMPLDSGERIADQRRGGRRENDERVADLVAHAFVAGEVEPLLLFDRAADGSAELMHQERGERLGARIEIVARVERGIAMEVVGGAVDVVGAGLDADVDEHAGFRAIVGAGLLGGVELLNRVERERAGGRAGDAGVVHDGFAVVGVVVVGAVDDEVVVVGAIAVGRERVEAAAGIALDAGMKREQVLEVAALERQLVDRFVGEDAAQHGVARFGERSFIFHFDGFVDRADLEMEIDFEIVADFDLHAFAHDFGEAGRFDGDRVDAGIDARRGVIAGRVGLQRAADVRAEYFRY